MSDLSGGEIIVEGLIKAEVPYLFGLCGHGIVGLMDAAMDRGDRIKTVSFHNEQIAGFAADAYYRVTRRPTATFTSCGPGSINIQMAIANALLDSSAVLAITGNIPTQQFNKGPFQELGQHYQADFPTAMRPYVKRSFQATRADMLPDMMRHACSALVAGRPGPVHLDVPFNVFTEKTDVPDTSAFRGGNPIEARSAPPIEAVDRALDLLLAAKRPAILAGYGCTIGDAGNDVSALADFLGIPKITTPQAKGVFNDADPLALGPTGRDGGYPGNRAARGCDVLLAIGTRFGDRSTSSWHAGVTHSIPPTRLIHVDTDPSAIGRNYPTELGIVADAALFARVMLQRARERNDLRQENREAWVKQAAGWKKQWRADTLAQAASNDSNPMHPARVIAEVSRLAPKGSILLSDIGAHHSWCVQQLEIPSDAMFLQSGGSATMGFGVGGAIGAAFAADGRRPVIAVVGDGGFLMHANAVATAVEHDLPIIWVVWNNTGFVSIRDLQKGFFGQDREFLTRFRKKGHGELFSTDFAMMGRAMGAVGVHANDAASLADAIATALRDRVPTVIDAKVVADVARHTAGAWDMPPIAGPAPNYDPDPVR